MILIPLKQWNIIILKIVKLIKIILRLLGGELFITNNFKNLIVTNIII